MAFTREFLTGLGVDGLTKANIDAIMSEHGATVEANKKLAEASLSSVQAQRDSRPDIKPDDLQKLRDDLSAATQSLKSFEGVDVAAMKEELEAARKAKDEIAGKQSEQMSAMATELLLRERMATERFSSEYARTGVLADIRGQVKYEPGEGGSVGTITGYDEAIAKIRESKPTAFAATGAASPAKDEGREHRGGGGSDGEKKKIPTLI